MTEKSKSEELKESLFYKRKNGRLVSSEEVLKKAEEYCEGYKSFLNTAKTEREAVKAAIALAKEKGFTEFVYGKKYDAGDKVYMRLSAKSLLSRGLI